MSVGRLAAYTISSILGLLGLLYLLSLGSQDNTNPAGKALVGVVLLAIAVVLFWITLKKAPDKIKQVRITQQVDLSADTELERLTCKSCGGALDSDSVTVADDGSVLVSCPYCSSAYQITEKPQW